MKFAGKVEVWAGVSTAASTTHGTITSATNRKAGIPFIHETLSKMRFASSSALVGILRTRGKTSKNPQEILLLNSTNAPKNLLYLPCYSCILPRFKNTDGDGPLLVDRASCTKQEYYNQRRSASSIIFNLPKEGRRLAEEKPSSCPLWSSLHDYAVISIAQHSLPSALKGMQLGPCFSQQVLATNWVRLRSS